MEWEKWTLFYILIELLSYMVFCHAYSILLMKLSSWKDCILDLQAAICKVRQCCPECAYLS